VDIDRSHAADAEEPARRHGPEHEVVTRQECIDKVLTHAGIHCDLVRTGTEFDAGLANINIAGHIHHQRVRLGWRVVAIVIGDEWRLGVALPRRTDGCAERLGAG